MMINPNLNVLCPTILSRTERLGGSTHSNSGSYIKSDTHYPVGNVAPVHTDRQNTDSYFSSPNFIPTHLFNVDYQVNVESFACETSYPYQTLPMANQRAVVAETTMPLSVHVEMAVRQYLSALEGEDTSDLYELILSQIEKPLLTVVLEFVDGNQSKCAQILGLNRGTLRKKLKIYHLMK